MFDETPRASTGSAGVQSKVDRVLIAPVPESPMPASSPSHLVLGLFGMPGGWEMAVVLVIGLLVFGRRLPEIGRSLGSSIVEFKRGIKGIGEEIESESERGGSSPAQLDQSNNYSGHHDPKTGGEKSPYQTESSTGEKSD
jgi:sec-independent protein translocase protein TatA